MNRCLRCGAVNHGKKPSYACKCGYFLVPITGHMLQLAQLLDSMGFRISSATDKIHIINVDDVVEIVMISIDFMRQYDSRVFEDLPDDFSHITYELVNFDTGDFTTYSKITHSDAFLPALSPDLETKRACRAAIRRLYAWFEEMKESGRWAIYVLGGLI